jgi:hypothetical protein
MRRKKLTLIPPGNCFFNRKTPLLNDTFSAFLSAFRFVATDWFTERKSCKKTVQLPFRETGREGFIP